MISGSRRSRFIVIGVCLGVYKRPSHVLEMMREMPESWPRLRRCFQRDGLTRMVSCCPPHGGGAWFVAIEYKLHMLSLF